MVYVIQSAWKLITREIKKKRSHTRDLRGPIPNTRREHFSFTRMWEGGLPGKKVVVCLFPSYIYLFSSLLLLLHRHIFTAQGLYLFMSRRATLPCLLFVSLVLAKLPGSFYPSENKRDSSSFVFFLSHSSAFLLHIGSRSGSVKNKTGNF